MAGSRFQSNKVFTGTNAERVALITFNVRVGDKFLESDTGAMYEWTGTFWLQIELPNVSSSLDIAKGLIAGHSVIFTPSANTDIGLTEEDVDDDGGTFVDLTSAQSLEILSSDAADASAGTGARTVQIETLDANHVTVIQTATLNGTTPVALTGTHLRARRMIVITAGSGGENAGILTLRVVAGQTMLSALASNNRSYSSRYTVPADKTAFLTRFLITVGKGQDAVCRLMFRPDGQVFISGAPLNVYQNDLQRPFPVFLSFAGKTDIKFTAISTNTGTDVSVTYDIILVDD
ncbi:MAG: hypothetical protein V3T88_02380 [Nitrosomonadaceae bacterium]